MKGRKTSNWKCSRENEAAERGKQSCVVIPVLAEFPGYHIPVCRPMAGLEAYVGVRSSPGSFLLVDNDLQYWSRKFWDILPKLAGDEEQRGTHGPWWPLNTVHRLGVQPPASF